MCGLEPLWRGSGGLTVTKRLVSSGAMLRSQCQRVGASPTRLWKIESCARRNQPRLDVEIQYSVWGVCLLRELCPRLGEL